MSRFSVHVGAIVAALLFGVAWLPAETDAEAEPAAHADAAEPAATEWLSNQLVNHSLLSQPKSGEKVTVSTIGIESCEVPDADHCCWSEDGSHLYIGERCGEVIACHLPDLTVDAVGDVGGTIDGITHCRIGLAITVDRQRVLVLDPDTLQVKRKVKVPKAHRIATAFDTPVLFVACDGQDLTDHQLVIVDALTGSVLKAPDVMDIANRSKGIKIAQRGQPFATSWEDLFCSADGKYLLATGTGSLHRFGVRGADLSYEEISAPYIRQQNFCPSPDGKYVAVFDTSNAEGLAHRAAGSWYLYRLTDLTTAIITIPVEHQEQHGLLFARHRKSFITLGQESLTIVAASGGATEPRALPKGTLQFHWMSGASDGSGCVIGASSGPLEWIAIDGMGPTAAP